jgi:hypothetical protein
MKYIRKYSIHQISMPWEQDGKIVAEINLALAKTG